MTPLLGGAGPFDDRNSEGDSGAPPTLTRDLERALGHEDPFIYGGQTQASFGGLAGHGLRHIKTPAIIPDHKGYLAVFSENLR